MDAQSESRYAGVVQWACAFLIIACGVWLVFSWECGSRLWLLAGFIAAGAMLSPPGGALLGQIHPRFRSILIRIILAALFLWLSMMGVFRLCGSAVPDGRDDAALQGTPGESDERPAPSGRIGHDPGERGPSRDDSAESDRPVPGEGERDAVSPGPGSAERDGRPDDVMWDGSTKRGAVRRSTEGITGDDAARGTEKLKGDEKRESAGTDRKARERKKYSGLELAKKDTRGREVTPGGKKDRAAREEKRGKRDRADRPKARTDSLGRALIAPWPYDRKTDTAADLRKGKTGDAFTSDTGDRYEGGIRNGMKHGYGVYRYRHGTVYRGMWVNDRAHGKGIIIWPNGDRYEGEWADNLRSGRGSYIWAMGDRYAGLWRDDRKEGVGVYTWKEGDRFEGQWLRGKREGPGEYIWPDGKRFRGIWKADKRQ